jgi:hypothetical protein
MSTVTPVIAANVEATAVSTIAWLAASETTIVVPVYQRQYRWDIGGCEQLLNDIRAVADAGRTTPTSSARSCRPPPIRRRGAHLVLIDGQQRITTLMLLVAALHHTLRDDDPTLAAELLACSCATTTPRTKLRPHRAWAEVFESVVLDRRAPARPRASRGSTTTTRSSAARSAWTRPLIWRGLTKLEHVSISLGPAANAQQTFESLNSTGEPLRDHELIHNYVLMGSRTPSRARSRTTSGCRSSRPPASRSARSGATT